MKTRVRLISAAILALGVSAHAWGPHWHITRAAIDALGPDDVLTRQLGRELLPLTNYCWLPDYRRLPFRTPEQDFYSDDYLLFPGVAKHFDHICPEVEQTYEPHFRRALQALRTESPANAARWIGSILHFVQDSGSPPHAAQIRGDVHSKMENWVVPAQITIPGYQARLLGTNDDDAMRGLVERMRQLIEFSKVRGQKLRLPVMTGNRRAVEPVALESALECARVSADVMHTLAFLAENFPARGYELGGIVQSPNAVSPGRFPARIILEDTTIATLADASGKFSIRGLEPRAYRVIAFQPGGATLRTNILASATTTNVMLVIPPGGSLVRNGNFSTQWVQSRAPDCWTKANGAWEGEILALKPGQRYRVRADFQADEGEVVVRWSSEQPFAVPKPTIVPRIQKRSLIPEAPQFIIAADTNSALMQLTIRTTGHPTNIVRNVSVTPTGD
jgi:hypothetical protein